MSKTAIVTDSNSGISPEEAGRLGVYLLPMPFFIDETLYFEGETLSQEEFFSAQRAGLDITTSQPTPGDVLSVWDRALEEAGELVYIPMSSALSGSCATAKALAGDYDGRVCVADNLRISATQRQSVLDALALAEGGLSAAEICAELERTAMDASIYISVDTLKYLKRGGRVTAAAAALGSVLNLKPVLTIDGGKLDALGLERGMAAAKRRMLDAVERDLERRFAGRGDAWVAAAYSCTAAQADEWSGEIRARFGSRYCGYIAPLALSISCHTGPGAYGVGVITSGLCGGGPPPTL